MVKIVNEAKVKRVTCPACNRDLEYEKIDIQHKEVESSEPIEYIVCPECHKEIRIGMYEYMLVYLCGNNTGRCCLTTNAMINSYERIVATDAAIKRQTGLEQSMLLDFKLLREVTEVLE